VIVIPSVEKLKHSYDGAGFGKDKVRATTAVKLSVLDARGALLWERVVPPRTVEKIYPSLNAAKFLEATSNAVNESIVLGLREAAKAMASAGEMHAYAEKSGGPAPAASREAAPVRSDIDEVPATRMGRNSRAYAVVVGIERYRQNLPRADFAVQDAKLVTEYVTKGLGFAEENVITLADDRAAKSDFEKYFERWLPNNVEPGSTVFVYFSGHGAPNARTGDAYLVPFDGDPAFIDETGYSLKRMYAALGRLPAKEVIVALAKGSRPLVMNLHADADLPKNVTVLSASGADQTSSTYEEKGHGLFTYFLLKGIRNEDVVRRDGSLDIPALFDYVKPQVSSIARRKFNNEQTPQLLGPKGR
jgi:hypothetical protein